MSTAPTTSDPKPPASAATAPVDNSVAGHFRAYVNRVRGGELGALPATVGLIVLCIVFGIARPDSFVSKGNFANLFQQGAQITIIAMGLIFVLLLGEIDLSAGFTSGVAAIVFAILLVNHGVPFWLCLLAAIGVGLATGLVLGLLVAKVRIPSFVVTLAAFLALQGVALVLLKGGNAITIQDRTTLAINNDNMPVWLGWTLFGVCVGGYIATNALRIRNRRARGLAHAPLSLVALKTVVLVVVAGAAVWVLSAERGINPLIKSIRGVPIIVPLIVALLLIWTFVLSRTSGGRHLYAVGGNPEAARRAGIRVDRVRIAAFVVCSTMAALGGIAAASRSNGVDPTLGGDITLLYAVGAAVIGGTSLYGGRGRIIDAVLGGAVIAVIDNGMGLMGLSAGQKYIFTGVVLLIAAGVDALSRRRAQATGR
jgi:D-xylose transport system permease protein